MKKCIYCNREISLNYLFKQKGVDNIKCPYCTKELKVNKISKLLGTSLLILVIAIIIILPCKYNIKIISIVGWTFICNYLLRPLIYVYE